jgi:hypothetical protein
MGRKPSGIFGNQAVAAELAVEVPRTPMLELEYSNKERIRKE